MIETIVDIYVRLSDQDRDKINAGDESESIQNQKTMLINYCVERGWHINNIYCDEDYSGADSRRPDWNKMLKDCEEGRCNTVLCKSLSRFARDVETSEKYIHGKFKEWGIRFVAVLDNADTDDKRGKKIMQVRSMMDEWYIADLSDNVKATLSTKRKNGEFVGSFAPYGYLIDPDNKNHLIIDEIAAPVVKRIFDMYIHGSGYISIAKALNEDKIPPPCIRKKQISSKYYNGNYENNHAPAKTWTDAAVYCILRRYTYTGALVQGVHETVNYKTKKRRKKSKEEWDVVEGMHEAIISKETYEKVQAIRLKRGKGQKIPSGNPYPLAKKVFCGECGNTMWKMSYKLAKGRYNYLACKTRKSSNGLCDNEHTMRLDELEGLVLMEINNLLDQYYDEKLIGKLEMPKRDDSFKNSIIVEIKDLEERIQKNNARISQMYTDKLDGVISQDEFSDYRERFVNESKEYQERIDILNANLTELGGLNNPFDAEKILEKYRHIETLTPEIADEFIKKIYIGKLKEDGTRDVRIIWNLSNT